MAAAPVRTKVLRATPRGFAGRFGGRWGKVPQPPEFFTTSVQVCGVYPFGAGTARPTDGAPLGQDMIVHTAVCTDHEALFRAGVISSPSCIIFGINGIGKSSTAQTIILGQVGRGMTPAIFNPLKDAEHSALIRSLGGDVFEMGPGPDKTKLNLMSAGPLGDAARKIGGQTGKELNELALAKSVQLVQLTARISRGKQLEDIEDTVLEALADTVRHRYETPHTRHIIEVFADPSERMLSISGQRTPKSFHKRFFRLGETLRSMMSGEMGQLLGGEESQEIDTGNPGGFCFDTSAIPGTSLRLQSAAMLGTWSLGMDAIDAHWELSLHEKRKAEEAAAEGEWYEPAVVWGGYTSFMEEFWYPVRACKGIVGRVDMLSRTQRSKGTADMKAMHSPKDLLSMPDPEDQIAAKGLTERAGLLGLMSLTRDDLIELSKVKPLTEKEIELVAGFNAARSWGKPKKKKKDDEIGKPTPPPGAGKILLKVEGRVGIPVQMLQTEVQKNLHITDGRYRD